MQHTMSDAVTRLWWAVRSHPWTAVITVALVTSAALLLPQLTSGGPQYQSTATVVATTLEIRSDQLPQFAASVFLSEDVAERAVAEGNLPVAAEDLIEDHARLEPVEDNIVLFVEGYADDPQLAAAIAASTADALVAELNTAGVGVGRFEVQDRARVPSEQIPGPPLAMFGLAGLVAGLLLAWGIIALMLVLVRPVLEADEAAALVAAPLLGELTLPRTWVVDLRTVVGLSAVTKSLFPSPTGTAFLVSCRGAETDAGQVALLVAGALARRDKARLVAGGRVPAEVLQAVRSDGVESFESLTEVRFEDAGPPTVVVGPSTQGLDAPQFLPAETLGVLVIRAGSSQAAVEHAARQFLPGELSGVVFTRPLDRRGRNLLPRTAGFRAEVTAEPGRPARERMETPSPSARADTGAKA